MEWDIEWEMEWDGMEWEWDGVRVGWSGSGSTMFKLKTLRQN